MFQELGASSLNFRIANSSGFHVSFFAASACPLTPIAAPNKNTATSSPRRHNLTNPRLYLTAKVYDKCSGRWAVYASNFDIVTSEVKEDHHGTRSTNRTPRISRLRPRGRLLHCLLDEECRRTSAKISGSRERP